MKYLANRKRLAFFCPDHQRARIEKNKVIASRYVQLFGKLMKRICAMPNDWSSTSKLPKAIFIAKSSKKLAQADR
jgi:hypothetical protein